MFSKNFQKNKRDEYIILIKFITKLDSFNFFKTVFLVL